MPDISNETLDEVERALETALGFGCPFCSGDCSSANPPVNFCPPQLYYAAPARLRAEREVK